jgi:predicted amidophosphoribosyltransferase
MGLALAATTRVDHLFALLFPARCPGCGRPAEPVCAVCLGRALPPLPAVPPPGIEAWAAPFAYDGVIRELVARSKFHGRHAALHWLGVRIAEAWTASTAPLPEVLTWVPAAPARRRARGIDHARVLARAVAAELRVPSTGLLVRRDRGAQTERALVDRRRGPAVDAVRGVSGTVMVVDDVTTTGATLQVCARALRGAGADHVVAATAARTPPGRARG